jgi:hypothetical protein
LEFFMKRVSGRSPRSSLLMIPAIGLSLLTLVSDAIAQESRQRAGDVKARLDGAWRLVSSVDPRSGQMRPVPEGLEMTKLIVGGRFGWIVAQNGQVVAGAGGRYVTTARAYTETVTYAVGQNQQPLIGTSTTFTSTMENGKWHHKGTLRVGQAKQDIDEIWERVP